MAETKKRGRPAKAKQGHLPDMEPPTVKEIDRAADDYRDVRDQRMELTKQETAKQAVLLELMRKHGLTHYEYDDYVVDIVANSSEKVKVKAKKVEDEE